MSCISVPLRFKTFPGGTLPTLRKPEVKGSNPFAGSIDSMIYGHHPVAVSFKVRIHVRIQIRTGGVKNRNPESVLAWFFHIHPGYKQCSLAWLPPGVVKNVED